MAITKKVTVSETFECKREIVPGDPQNYQIKGSATVTFYEGNEKMVLIEDVSFIDVDGESIDPYPEEKEPWVQKLIQIAKHK